MKVIYIDSKFSEEIVFGKELIDYLKKNKFGSVAIFVSTQFTNIKKVNEQLKKINVRVLTTKASRTNSPIQILGCDCYSGNFEKNLFEESDAIIYIGDGLFHPKALLLAQKNILKIKPIIIWDPISKKMKIIDEKIISLQIKKMKQNLKAFILSKNVGVLVSQKPGQQYFSSAIKLKKKLESEGKKVYIFVSDSVNFQDFDNFNFIRCWVNTACPRIGTDDIVNLDKPLINIVEAFNSVKALDELG
jgi:diphthamide biosynthesis enzyme Dph1/Dph2-like protein